jgi:hypothetical protein
MSDFDERLQKAIGRGQKSRDAQDEVVGAQKANIEDLRAIYGQLRLALSEHIETGLRKLCDHFPGFDFSTIVNEDGWGARITRDDINLRGGNNRNLYSRLEMLVKPFSDSHILDINTKGTIRNRESLNRSNYRLLSEANEDGLKEIIDGLVLEFAEQYSANG